MNRWFEVTYSGKLGTCDKGELEGSVYVQAPTDDYAQAEKEARKKLASLYAISEITISEMRIMPPNLIYSGGYWIELPSTNGGR